MNDPFTELRPHTWRDGAPTLADVLPAVAAALGVDLHPSGNDREGQPLTIGASSDVVLLLIDGLGATLLTEHAASAPTLTALAADGDSSTLRAGFPATTATSITSLTVGAPCGVHGIIGYSFRPDDACRTRGSRRVLNALRWSMDRADGPSALQTYPPDLVRQGVGALESLADAGVRITYVMPGEFRGTGLTLAAFRAPGRYHAAVTPDGIRTAVALTLGRRSRHRRFIYAYLSDLDTAGHLHGPGSPEWVRALEVVDRLVADLLESLPPDTTLLVTGDHGMIAADRAIDIDSHPTLLAGTSAIAGEARVRHIYTSDGAGDDVAAAWSDTLGDAAWVVTRTQAVDEGWFGTPVSEDNARRIGDVVAVSRASVALTRSRHEPLESMMIGHHGSWTAAEQLVPLVVARS